MYYYLYLADISRPLASIITKHTQSLTLTLFLSEHRSPLLCFLETTVRSTESISKNTMNPTSFTSRKLLLLLLISSLGLIFVFLLSPFSTTTTTTTTTIASRLLIPKTGQAHGDDIVVNIDEGLSQMNSVLEKGLKDENLMGVEEEDCGDQGDEEEECLKRRMISEAHLDYIYTQHQHP